jgi:hypothetical protein
MRKRRVHFEETDIPLEQREALSLQAYKQAYKEYVREPLDYEDGEMDYLKRAGFQFRKNPDAKLE